MLQKNLFLLGESKIDIISYIFETRNSMVLIKIARRAKISDATESFCVRLRLCARARARTHTHIT